MPLSKLDELFALLKGAKYFTALDLCIGYYHNKLDQESIPKSAFTTVFSKFDFFRLTLWTITRSRLLHLSYLWPFWTWQTSNKSQGSGYLAYLDDILIYSKTKKEHLEMLNDAFAYLHKASLKIKLSKCSFSLTTNPLFRSLGKWNFYPPTYRQNWSAHETKTPNQY